MNLFAQPYNQNAQGFYFNTLEEYESKVESLQDSFGNPVEEFEIIPISHDAAEFAKAEKPSQCNLEQWLEYLEQFEGMTENERIALIWLADIKQDIAEAMDKYQDVIIFDGTAEDYAQELVDDCYGDVLNKMGNLSCYFDYKALARDLVAGGDIVEINRTTFIGNPNDF